MSVPSGLMGWQDNDDDAGTTKAVVAGVEVLYQGRCVTCPAEWRPVCDTSGRTRSNKCYAEVAGVTIGCQGSCPCPQPCLSCSVSCTSGLYQPVCDTRGRTWRTECRAVISGATVECEVRTSWI